MSESELFIAWTTAVLTADVLLVAVSVLISSRPKPVGDQAWRRRIAQRKAITAAAGVLFAAHLTVMAVRLL